MAEYRIDELAHRAGTTVRNVRVYQDRGLLAPPRRAGRIGWYDDAHLERLHVIGRLLDRGYTFATIRELLTTWAGGGDLGDVLGLGEAISGPWTEEEPGHITVEALRLRFGQGADESFLAEAVRLGLLEPDGRRYRVPSPRLLDAGADLVASGVPLRAVHGIAAGLRVHLDQVAELLFGAIAANLPAGSPDPSHLAEVVARLRPHALRAVEATFGMAMRDRADDVLAGLQAPPRASSA